MPEFIPSQLSLLDRLRERIPRASVTRSLIGINLIVFVAMLATGAGLWHSSNGVQLAWGANFGPATQDGQWWRLGSAMFLHFGVIHLAMNMWALWDSGQFVERMFGHQRFLLIYLIAGLGGNLVSLVWHEGHGVSGGASGAIFGIYAALLVFLWLERQSIQPGEFRWLFWAATVFSIVTIVFGLVVTGIDNAAHIGGFVSGLLAGLVLHKPLERSISPGPKSGLIGAGLMVFSVAILVTQIPELGYRWHDEQSAQREIRQFLRTEMAINQAWQKILLDGRRGNGSFDELAGRVDSLITDRYEESFEQLSSIPSNPALPSNASLESLRRYAERKRDASRALAQGLRAKDPKQIRRALEQAQTVSPSPPGH